MTTQQVDPLRECKQARDRLIQAQRNLAEAGRFFSTLGEALQRNPTRLMLTNTSAIDFRAPAEIGLDPDVPRLDISRWPSPEKVASALKEYYDADFAYQEAHRRLPPDEQKLFSESYGWN